MASTTLDISLDKLDELFDGDPPAKSNKAQATKNNKQILAALTALGGQRVQDDSLVFEGDKIVLPKQYEGRIPDAINFLYKLNEEMNSEFAVNRQFNFHPFDVANAFQRVLKAVYGTTGIGKATKTLFGTIPPRYQTVVTGPNGESVQVPWGEVTLPALEANFAIGGDMGRAGEMVGNISVTIPKRNRGAVEGLFKAIEADLAEHSLYRGKAIDGNWHAPDFLDLSGVNESKVVYSTSTREQINANLWSVVEHPDEIKAAGMQLKRAILLEGPYGTGKSLTGYLTAQKAVDNGWTFIYCRPGQSLGHAFHAAKLYAPSVVFFEDLDVVADSGDTSEAGRVSQLLDMFDGVSNKTTPIVAVLTTNHVERLHRGMLRPGRLDAVIHIGELDAEAIEQLIRGVIPEGKLAANVDWPQVTLAMKGFLPAFIKEATERSLRYVIARGDGEAVITTADLVNAAEGLRPQLDLMTGANEAKEPDTLTDVVEDIVRDVVHSTDVQFIGRGDREYRLVETSEG